MSLKKLVRFNWFHQRIHPYFFAFYLVGLVFFIFGNASSNQTQVQANNASEIEKIRQTILFQLHQGFKLNHHPIIENYTYDLARNLLFGGAINPSQYQFHLAHSPRLNAFASADGIILLTSELVVSVDRVDEFASVIAHEIGHINGSHISRSIDASEFSTLALGLGILGALITKDSDVAGALIYGSAAYGSQNQLSYSRDFEWEADRFATELMNQSGFDASYLVSFLKKLASNQIRSDQSFEFLSTHPLTPARIAEANARVSQLSSSNQQINLSLIRDDFAFYQALVRYFSHPNFNTNFNADSTKNNHSELQTPEANQLLNWLRSVNFANHLNPNTRDNPPLALDDGSDQTIEKLIGQFPNSRILPMIEVEYLIDQINQINQISQTTSEQIINHYENKIKQTLGFFAKIYPQYYPAIYYSIAFNHPTQGSSDNRLQQVEKAEQAIKELLTLKNLGLDESNYFLSPSILAEQIAEQYGLDTHIQWARAVQAEIRHNLKKARDHYFLAKQQADQQKKLELAELFSEKLQSFNSK